MFRKQNSFWLGFLLFIISSTVLLVGFLYLVLKVMGVSFLV
ncbi:hypothetical protein BAU18_002570 [Enterococcus diestrammenae]|uniref:Uncharacterized protein n=1 Tax=Enterococcus diestrammenae TaxID=1155073 RepID=A0ABV0F4F3_9ENTE